jgi:hypothetical protein
LPSTFLLVLLDQRFALECCAILQERDSDQFARIVVDVDPAEPHAIKEVELRAIPRPADFPITRTTEAEALKAFRAYLRPGCRRRSFLRGSPGCEKRQAGLHCRVRHGRPGKEDS